MTIARMLRMIAGTMLLLSVGVAVSVDLQWLWFTAFVGLNLLQSPFTGWSPIMPILADAGVKSS